MIINPSYFLTKEVFIPNAVVQPSIGSVSSSYEQLKEFSEEKEDELLLKFLGYTQLQELKLQFDEAGEWKVDALQKWKDLVDGKEDWKGLRYTLGGKKYSLIANYVFFYYLGTDFKQYTTTGIQVPMAEDSMYQTPNETQIRVWNKFVKLYQGNQGTNAVNFFNNWNGFGASYLSNNGGNQVSLYDFMSKNSEVYDISFFNFERPINSYNL